MSDLHDPARAGAVRGRHHAVVSGHPLAARQADAVLRSGGNAFDAALSGAAVLCVALPHACGLGGDCFALVRANGKTWSLNGSGPAPRRLPAGLNAAELAQGPASGAVPGMVAGWQALHERFGSRPWAELMQPAATLARAGVEVSNDLAQALRLFAAPLAADAGLAALFLRNQAASQGGGTVLRQPELAAAFDAIARDGARALYEGELGASLCAAVQARGGHLARSDLAGFEAEWAEPLEHRYRGHVVQVAPPNSFGLYMLLQLAALEDSGIERHDLMSVDRAALLMRAARAGFAAGERYVADPRSVIGDASTLLSADSRPALRAALAREHTARAVSKSQGTAVISVVDDRGNAVTLVQSIFKPFGSLVCDPDTGIVLNNRLAGFSASADHPNGAAPGKRPAHTLNPVMVLRDGRLRYLLGTPGGSGQTITLTHVLSAVLDLGHSLADAVHVPRWSMDLEGGLLIEPGFVEPRPQDPRGEDEVLAALRDRGLSVRVARAERFYFGSAECIEVDDEGGYAAVADHRRDAVALAG